MKQAMFKLFLWTRLWLKHNATYYNMFTLYLTEKGPPRMQAN